MKFKYTISGHVGAHRIRDINQFILALQDMRDDIVDSFEQNLEEAAEQIKKEAQRIIKSQSFSATELAESTIIRKGHSNIFLDSDFYIKNLEVTAGARKLTGYGKGSRSTAYFWYVGPNEETHPGRSPKDTDRPSLQQVVAWLEYGNVKNNQPPRPFWGTRMADVANKILNSFHIKGGFGGAYYVDRLKRLAE